MDRSQNTKTPTSIINQNYQEYQPTGILNENYKPYSIDENNHRPHNSTQAKTRSPQTQETENLQRASKP